MGPLVDLLEHGTGRTGGAGAIEGVRPTFGCGYFLASGWKPGSTCTVFPATT
jgi:hypothetical protein